MPWKEVGVKTHCAVGFDIQCLCRVKAGRFVNLLDQSRLRSGVGQKDASSLAVLIYSGVEDDRMDRIAISESMAKAFEHDSTDSLSTTISGPPTVKSKALPF
jgi:hypothetical protein